MTTTSCSFCPPAPCSLALESTRWPSCDLRRAGRVLVGTFLVACFRGITSRCHRLATVGIPGKWVCGTYGPPLLSGEQTTRELLDLVNRGGGRELSVETDDVNDVAIGYLARPFVPEVQVAPRRRGPWNVDFDLPNPPGGAPYALAAEPQLTAPESHEVSYADGVKVLSQATHGSRALARASAWP